MEYLKNYNITEAQIQNLKDIYSDEIISFLVENREFVEEKLKYLKEEKFEQLYNIMYNNIKVFIEEKQALVNKVETLKKKNISHKAINMILIEENLYDEI